MASGVYEYFGDSNEKTLSHRVKYLILGHREHRGHREMHAKQCKSA
jgi:hypothetical protein